MFNHSSFVHHVYFWLKNPGNATEATALYQGIQSLKAIPAIRHAHIGVPAETNRDVIDTSYSFSWLAVFDSQENEEAYQVHPIHLTFVEKCKHLWSKVIVYDSVPR